MLTKQCKGSVNIHMRPRRQKKIDNGLGFLFSKIIYTFYINFLHFMTPILISIPTFIIASCYLSQP